MKLLFPKNKKKWNPKKLPSIPDKWGGESNALMIAAGQKGFDLYVCFTTEERKEVWIEKASILNADANALTFEMLKRIDEDSEFTFAHQFFLKEGFLDATPKKV